MKKKMKKIEEKKEFVEPNLMKIKESLDKITLQFNPYFCQRYPRHPRCN